MSLPTDSNSLLVPIFLNAWVVDSQTQQVLARYEPDYSKLSSFADPLPIPQIPGLSGKPTPGIYLKWALPDALTHAEQATDGSIDFPFVPNRWVVVRNTAGDKGATQQKAWVIQSDFTESMDNSPSFLDPNKPSTISNDGTSITVNGATIGKNHTIDAWETKGDPGTDNFFLKAVGPGNISFAAYQPFCQDVFAFTDNDLPAEGSGEFSYSYMVVGWYSNPSKDPLADATSENFTDLLQQFLWSLPSGTAAPSTPPVTSLYHGFLADVQWPSDTLGNGDISNVDIAVGNTAMDALSALIQNYAAKQTDNKDEWIAAGNTLSSLIQAAMLQLLDDYGAPGGQALVQQQVVQSWFGASPGGTVWKIANVTPEHKDFNIAGDNLSPAQNKALIQQLAQLNEAQQNYDAQQRTLQSMQQQLYILWLDVAQSQNFGFGGAPKTIPDWDSVLKPVLTTDLYPDLYQQVWELLCLQNTAKAALPNIADMKAANEWVNKNWSFPAADGSDTLTLADLNLVLKGAAAPPFQHPTDPVVLINGAGRSNIHGEDGAYNTDGTLMVRLPSQTITGLKANNQPEVTAQAVATSGVIFDALSQFTTIPAIPNLLTETFFCDPQNGFLMAAAVSGTDGATLTASITSLLDQKTDAGTWDGIPPSPVGYSLWVQAWAPLWMEWMVNYYPTADDNLNFEMDSWTFNGTDYNWNGGGFSSSTPQPLQFSGRSVVSPYAQTVFKTALTNYLQNHPTIDNSILDTLIDTVMGWDILSQSLGGLNDQLITLLSQTTFPPPVSSSAIACPPPKNASPSNGPKVGNLVQDQFHHSPMLQSTLSDNLMFPVRGALVDFAGLQLVDTFGQTYQLNQNNSPQGFQPLISQYLTPPSSITLPSVFNNLVPFVLGPRLIQSTRLNLDFLANDGSSTLSTAQNNDNPICGWLLPNHLDKSLDVYDAEGVLLGALNSLGTPNNWRPRPGAAGSTPPPSKPSDIANEALKNVVVALAAQTAAVFEDFIQVVDETLWMSDPLGGQSDTFLSALIGRPLAVTMMDLSLELNGNTATSQLWNDMLTNDSTATDFTQKHHTGGIENIPFPLRLGSITLRNDGLMGYFLPDASNPYDTFYAVHNSPTLSAGDTFIKPIIDATGGYQGNISLQVNRFGSPPVAPVTATMILDPLGVIHGYTGILPVASTALPAYQVQNFLKKLLVNFQAGPVLTDLDTPAAIRTPLPAEKQGTWDWLQSIKGDWVQDTIVNANDAARFPLQPPVLKEGWLQLKDIDTDD